jgi:protein-S-isoprenylcysteine O-methyltransferase Ste14
VAPIANREPRTTDAETVTRFRRILLVNVALLAVVGVAIAASAVWVGWSRFVVALLIFFAITIAYLVYVMQRFTR